MTFRGIRWVVAAFILLAASGIVDAQDIVVTSQVDRRQIAANEAVKLTLTIISDRPVVHVQAPQIDLSAFEVHGPSVSTHVHMGSRLTSFSRDLEYTLYARKAGRHTIGAASLEIDGK
ncbi:MAG: BatD family protein, partial [Candidatus Latescibacteria bacterium]|nr:BatD family protein [Candidatus Latescibacterota bacterium]